MKISKIFLTVFLIGFLLFGFLYIWNGIQYGKKKAVWEAEVVRLDAEIEELEKSAAFNLKSADEWRDKAFKTEEDIAKLKTKMAKADQQHAIDMAKVAELVPDEIVIRVRELLGASEDEIVLTPSGVVFTVETTRLVLTQLKGYDFVMTKRVPDFEKLLAKKDKLIGEKKLEIGKLRSTIDDLQMSIDDWKKKYEGEHTLRLSAEKFSLFSPQNLVIGGVVAVVAGGVILLLK